VSVKITFPQSMMTTTIRTTSASEYMIRSKNHVVLAVNVYSYIATTISSSLSALSSALIIFIILKSNTGLHSIYHRIMFGMSLGDLLSSFAMALTMLPAPPHMEDEVLYGYDFETPVPRYGNTATCSAQGFFISFGSILNFGYYGMLCIYYVFAIGFCMEERKIVRYVEPILHFLPLTCGLGAAITALGLQMINPSRSEVFCSIIQYPHQCFRSGDCIRGSTWAATNHVFPLAFLSMISFDVVLVVASMVIVVFAAIRKERRLNELLKSYLLDNSNSTRTTMLLDDTLAQNGPMAIIVQALLYTSTFMLALIFPILRLTGTKGLTIDLLRMTFSPLQGFFNILIFVGHKIYSHRRFNHEVGRMEVVKQLLLGTLNDPVFLTRVHIVALDQLNRGDSQSPSALVEVVIEDESGAKREFLFDEAQLPGDNGPANDMCHDDNGMEQSNIRIYRTNGTTTAAEGPRTIISVQDEESSSIGFSYPSTRDTGSGLFVSEETFAPWKEARSGGRGG